MPDESKIVQWTRLSCPSCGVSTEFYKKVRLITRQGGGTTEEIAGFVCRQCSADVDLQKAHHKLEVERKRAELKALQEELTPALPPEAKP